MLHLVGQKKPAAPLKKLLRFIEVEHIIQIASQELNYAKKSIKSDNETPEGEH